MTRFMYYAIPTLLWAVPATLIGPDDVWFTILIFSITLILNFALFIVDDEFDIVQEFNEWLSDFPSRL